MMETMMRAKTDHLKLLLQYLEKELVEEFAYGLSLGYLRNKGYSDEDVIKNNYLPYLVDCVQRDAFEIILKEIVQVVNDVTKSDSVFIYLVDEPQNQLVLMASKTPHKKELGSVALKIGEGITGWVAKFKVPQLVDDSADDPRGITIPGTEADLDKPGYHRLTEQIKAICSANTSWRWIYLMGQTTNDEVFIQIDSEPDDSPDMSPPGQVYEEATPELHGVFQSGQSFIEGPLTDRWGTWTSAFVPLKDPRTDQLIMVVGIDIESSQWNRMQLERIVVDYIDHYNEKRPHRSLDQRPPCPGAPTPIRPNVQVQVARSSRCDGLIYEYRNAA
jgi:hypothetical protein